MDTYVKSELMTELEQIQAPDASFLSANFLNETEKLKFGVERWAVDGFNAAHDRVESLVRGLNLLRDF